MPRDKRPKAGLNPKSQKEANGSGVANANAANGDAGLRAGKCSGAALPPWPRFKPALPMADLEMEMIIPEVVVFRHFFPKSLCRDYVAFLQNLPLVKTPATPKRGEALRKNSRYQVEDAAFANRLWVETGLKEALLADETLSQLWYSLTPVFKASSPWI